MITGDKLETAQNIAVACHLVGPETDIQPESSIEECIEQFKQSRLIQITGNHGKLCIPP
jgi:magnesium-transporting ATPase (P-type)